MNLSRKIIGQLKTNALTVPAENQFDFPEKVVQFGTGVLLRGLIDYFVDKSNKAGKFGGRIVLIKSTSGGEAGAFSRQDNLYTHCIRGIENGINIQENIINASISRVIDAKSAWEEVLALACDPNLELIVSNTTEVGIRLVNENIHSAPPQSYPGKLLAFLYQRFKIFSGEKDKGMVIIPTELLPDNGKRLKEIVLALAACNGLEKEFVQWITQANEFCSSLVDRIVPGRLPAQQLAESEAAFGYQDDLMIMSESYCLWAVETSNAKAASLLNSLGVDKGLVVAPDIRIYRELKLRLLNGPHTHACGLAYLSGFDTVKEAMQDKNFSAYINSLMVSEIIPSITDHELTSDMAMVFSQQVLDRFRNPFLNHKWLSITLQYSSKMNMRNLPLLLRYYERFGSVPGFMAIGFAAHILFMRPVNSVDGQFYGEFNGKDYLIDDNNALIYAEKWKNPHGVVFSILGEKQLWGRDLNELPGFTSSVKEKMELMQQKGVRAFLEECAVEFV
ncbi:MAG: altronate oxidoreductase [Bacteroidetes bacterium]|nr:MAG: altronate oxidoreductase [Bacteroidota bacterium]